MSRREDATAHREFGAEHWEEHHRSGGSAAHEPSPLLLAETGALAPGRALDAGCGRGANAVWLASRGWHVTAVDVSPTALARAEEAARAAGQDVADRIEWVCADLVSWDPGDRRFALVTSLYVHLPQPAADLFRRLAGWVAPAGTLLVVGHDDGRTGAPTDHAHGHTHPPGARIRAEHVTGGLVEGSWEVVVAESRTHVVPRPGGAGPVTLQDTVVRARRTGP